MSGGTRLDRLLNLLEVGTTQATRKAAAQQIGEIQKYHPYDLQKLLLRIHQYLRNEKWETRIASGYAISAVAGNVPEWDPEYKENVKPEENNDEILNTNSLKFHTFDIRKVIEFGSPLLASGGSEYDDSFDTLDTKDRVEQQRKALEQRMGLFGGIMNDIVEEKDLLVTQITKEQQRQRRLEEEEAKRKAAEIASALENTSSMSAREKNRIKRKAKSLAKTKERERRLKVSSGGLADSVNQNSDGSTKKGLKSVVTSQPQNSDKVVIEAVADSTLALEDELSWPFSLICNVFCNELFDPAWEVRHGAAIGLREIIKLHAKGAGKTADATKEEQIIQNNNWLEDCCIRLICVLTLDRFGDFIGDQVVAPVRETCAQALGALLSHMNETLVKNTFNVLLQLHETGHWEVRHGGLLGLKYAIAVRHDMVTHLLPKVLPVIITGLEDKDDDVRAVASETLLPVAKETSDLSFSEMPRILSILWDTLEDLDDLTASTNSVMSLLAEFYSYPSTSEATNTMLAEFSDFDDFDGHPLSRLIPRLWPFFRHNISSVRASTLTTLHKLLNIGPDVTQWVVHILPDIMRHVFQAIVLDTKAEIVTHAHQVWQEILQICPPEIIRTSCIEHLFTWFQIVNTPIGRALDPNLIYIASFRCVSSNVTPVEEKVSKKRGRPKGSTNEPGSKKLKLSGNNNNNEFDVTGLQLSGVSTIEMRVNGCISLGRLASIWPLEFINEYYMCIMHGFSQNFASERIAAGMIMEEWASALSNKSKKNNGHEALVPEVVTMLSEMLQQEEVNYYDETLPIKEQLVSDYTVLVNSLSSVGINTSFPEIANLTLHQAIHIGTSIFDECVKTLSANVIKTTGDQLEVRRKRLLTTISIFSSTQSLLHLSVLGTLSSVLISWNSLPSKLNPVIHSLMTSIKTEENEILQSRIATSIARLIKLVVSRKPCPNSKIIKNICCICASDRSITPLIQQSLPTPTDEEVKAASIARRGADYCLISICKLFQENVFVELPFLWENMTSLLTKNTIMNEDHQSSSSTSPSQNFVDSLQIFIPITPVLSSSLHHQILQLLPHFFFYIQTPIAEIRTMIARCLAIIAKTITVQTMQSVILNLLPLLSNPENEICRLGAAESLHCIISSLAMEVIPYIVFLVVPILGRMSDQNIEVRRLITNSFATLVRLMPLEVGYSDPIGFPDELIERRKKERHFLEQLLDGSKLDTYEVPFPLNVELRKYQQDGLNWLAFLQKYKLHGILCDDMGLGKTLQTLCIVISDNFLRKRRYGESKSVEWTPLPSLVVCPPTVVGHWFHETLKFFSKYATPIQYVGNPNERAKIRDMIANYDIVVMSYDILRNDIDHLKNIIWNYCVLDEGHIIRNSKTKITQATKQVHANNRLILSGTPIQNNVLELWSLFDFLMPGFLGTERQFNELFGKPILASKDPKCSAKDQEAGTLALESLHRQVLPFLLRRVKEDVLHDLPPKIIQDYYCDLSALQRRLYEDFADNPNVNDDDDDDQNHHDHDHTGDESKNANRQIMKHDNGKAKGKKKGSHIFQALQYIRKLCNHPLLVLNEHHPEYSSVIREYGSLDALHDLSFAPKLLALKQLLLDCGIGVSHSQHGKNSNNNNDQVDPANMSVVQHRVLMFAQLKSMLDIVENDLLKKFMPNVSYLRLDGSIPFQQRHNIVTQFNEDPTIDILLLTTHVGGLGLNLTGADTVIFIEHDWNPMKDLQAMDRAHRLGQTKVVNVYRLITRGTLEQKIMGLQKFKLNIANSVVNQDNSSIRTMDTDQLLDLFTLSEDTSVKASDSSYTDEMGNVKTKPKSGVKAMLDEIGELWDESQYEEYDLNNFLDTLKK